MLSRFRHLFGVLFFLLIASCSGGGCGGCSGCAGMTPLPGGFPVDQAVQNAASVRVSRPGLDFIEKQLGPITANLTKAPNGILGFDIPAVDPPKAQIANLSILGKVYLDPNVCPGGPDPNANPPRCHANVNIGASAFQIDSVTPKAVKLSATIPLELEDTPIEANVNYDPPILDPVDLGELPVDDDDGRPLLQHHAHRGRHVRSVTDGLDPVLERHREAQRLGVRPVVVDDEHPQRVNHRAHTSP